jgi:hypothetical protein
MNRLSVLLADRRRFFPLRTHSLSRRSSISFAAPASSFRER